LFERRNDSTLDRDVENFIEAFEWVDNTGSRYNNVNRFRRFAPEPAAARR
jgi:hypothetical protein